MSKKTKNGFHTVFYLRNDLLERINAMLRKYPRIQDGEIINLTKGAIINKCIECGIEAAEKKIEEK